MERLTDHPARRLAGAVLCVLALAFETTASAQQSSQANDAAQANNPLANITAFNVQQYFIGELTDSDQSANDPAISFGIGPQLTAATASDDDLGSEKWSAGFANVLFNARSKKVQWGYLLTWQASFAGDSDAEDVNAAALQPFIFYQLGKGLYLRSAPIWTYNFENDDYSVPLGLGIGKVITSGKTVYNFFAEPQYSVADRGPGQPQWQVYFGLNMQFKD
ncbi:MAG: hypothetical protein P8X82_18225 [Gemmatimonadales bacterium]